MRTYKPRLARAFDAMLQAFDHIELIASGELKSSFRSIFTDRKRSKALLLTNVLFAAVLFLYQASLMVVRYNEHEVFRSVSLMKNKTLPLPVVTMKFDPFR